MPDFGDGSPREEYGAVDPLAPSVANGQITPEQWAEYQRQRRRAAMWGIIGTLGGMAGGGLAAGAVNGTLSGAAGSAASGAALPPVAGGAPWAVTPLATTATMSAPGAIGAGAGAGVGGALGAAGKTIMGLSPRDFASIATSLAGTVGGAMSNKPVTAPTTATTDPNLQKLVATMQGRLDQSEPLYKSIMAMANGLLPTQYQNGGAGR